MLPIVALKDNVTRKEPTHMEIALLTLKQQIPTAMEI